MYDVNPRMFCSLGVCIYHNISELCILIINVEFKHHSIMSDMRSSDVGPEEPQSLWNYCSLLMMIKKFRTKSWQCVL